MSNPIAKEEPMEEEEDGQPPVEEKTPAEMMKKREALIEKDTNMEADDESSISVAIPDSSRKEDFNMETRRRLKNEARVSSGIGKAKQKERNLKIFWKFIWPKLEEAGWTKHEGAGAQAGAITFLPKGSSVGQRPGFVTGEHYERIRDVLDRLEEGRSQSEVAIFNLYRSVKESDAAVTPENTKNEFMLKTPPTISKMDLSWKDGGRTFPRKTSRTGEQYQVTELPKAGTFNESGESSVRAVLWDPKKAREANLYKDGALTIVEKVPNDKHEAALELLVERHYVPGDDFVETIAAFSARNGSDWPAEKKARFGEAVFKHRKDFRLVCADLNIDMTTCLAHYYAVYRQSDGYRLLRTVVEDEKADLKASNSTAEVSGEPDSCLVCDDGGELLICDGCEGEYHMECMDPALKSVPDGLWECDECVNKKLLAVRDYLVRHSGLFELQHKEDHEHDTPEVFTATPMAQASIRTMARGISRLLAPAQGEDDDENEEEEEEANKTTPKRAAKAIKEEEEGSSVGSGSKRQRRKRKI